jgi:hypothetical protein
VGDGDHDQDHAQPVASSIDAAGGARTMAFRSVVEVVRDHLEELRDETGYSVPAGVADEIGSLVERLR